jgi:hypothetical protein
MSRAFLVTVHMYLSAFFAPFILMVAISGGLYLAGVKGDVHTSPVFQSSDYNFNIRTDDLKAEVDSLLAAAGVTGYSYEYVKDKGATLYTRPTSRTHYVITLGEGVEILRAEPNLQAALMELHMGHGPGSFKLFQQVFALGLLFIILSGLWLGLSAAKLRRRTLLTSLSGAVVFLLLALL